MGFPILVRLHLYIESGPWMNSIRLLPELTYFAVPMHLWHQLREVFLCDRTNQYWDWYLELEDWPLSWHECGHYLPGLCVMYHGQVWWHAWWQMCSLSNTYLSQCDLLKYNDEMISWELQSNIGVLYTLSLLFSMLLMCPTDEGNCPGPGPLVTIKAPRWGYRNPQSACLRFIMRIFISVRWCLLSEKNTCNTLQWHNECDDISNHWRLDCLFNCFF